MRPKSRRSPGSGPTSLEHSRRCNRGEGVTENPWRILSHGDDSDLVLAVDFASTGRLQAGFRELVPRLSPPVTVWEALPPAARQVAANGYVEWWLAEIRDRGRAVRA